MNKFLILLLLLFSFAAAIQWNKEQSVKLKKDQPYRVVFNEQVANGIVKREFVLRWTLFVNEGLTAVVKYDGFNHHQVFSKRYGRDTFNLKILPKQDNEMQAPYISIVFEEFDDANKEAYFKLYIKDNDRTNMEQISPTRIQE